ARAAASTASISSFSWRRSSARSPIPGSARRSEVRSSAAETLRVLPSGRAGRGRMRSRSGRPPSFMETMRMSRFLPSPALGVGFTYQRGLRDAMGPDWDRLDFFELSPDVLCHERLDHGARVLDYDPDLLADALRGTAAR